MGLGRRSLGVGVGVEVMMVMVMVIAGTNRGDIYVVYALCMRCV